MSKVLKILDGISEWVGKGSSWLILVLVFGIGYEVVVRYVFIKPTFWEFDVTWMTYGVYAVLGAAYCHLAGSMVRMDLFYGRFSPRGRSIIDVIGYCLFFFPLMVILVKTCGAHAIWSWSVHENASASTWRPPVYPFKITIVIGFGLLLLQGISGFVKSILVIRRSA